MNLADKARRLYHSRLIGHEFPATTESDLSMGQYSLRRSLMVLLLLGIVNSVGPESSRGRSS